ncbi:hypothetical protein BsWGS_23110 [Bradybaena similaris]
MKTVFLLILCWSIFGEIKAKELSKKLLDFLTFVTGDVDNKFHAGLKSHDYDVVQARVLQVHVPALDPHLTLLVEQATNGVIRVFHLGVVTDGPGDTVTMKLYNFTDYSNLTYGCYNLERLSDVKLEDLQSDDECVATFEVVGKGLMTGLYPNCRFIKKRKHPYMIVTYACEFDTVIFPHNTDQKYMVPPYVFRHAPYSGSLKDAPDDYISPCNC